MTTDPTTVVPGKFVMSVAEVWTLPFDASAYLSTGESVSNVVAAMTKVSDGSTVVLADAPTVAGNVISQKLNGPAELTSGDLFRLRFTFTVSPTTDLRVMTLMVSVTE